MYGIQYKCMTHVYPKQWSDHLSKDEIINRTKSKLAQMLELSDRNCKINVTNMLKDLEEKAGDCMNR